MTDKQAQRIAILDILKYSSAQEHLDIAVELLTELNYVLQPDGRFRPDKKSKLYAIIAQLETMSFSDWKPGHRTRDC